MTLFCQKNEKRETDKNYIFGDILQTEKEFNETLCGALLKGTHKTDYLWNTYTYKNTYMKYKYIYEIQIHIWNTYINLLTAKS